MRARALVIGVAISGCSLLVNPHAENDYDLRDGGGQATDGGMDAGAEVEVDAAGMDAGPVIPSAPQLRFPWNGFMTGSVHTGGLPPDRNALRPRFVWEEVMGADRYEIQLTAACEAQTRDTCSFDGAIEGTATATEWRPEEALPVSMTAPVGRRYVWRLRACNAAGCSDWSQVRYLDVGRQPSDFNGDGYADVLVGAPNEGGVGNVYIFHGPTLDGFRALNDFIGAGAGSGLLGWVIGAVGDVDADGFPDAVVSELVGPSGSVQYAGRAYLLTGLDDGIGLDVARSVVLESPHPRATGLFAGAVGGGGDIDGDGYGDFVIGAPQEDVDTLTSAGRVYVFRGGASIRSLEAPLELVSPAPSSTGLFGYAVSIAGDLNGDGLVDLVVGAAGETGAGTDHSGRAYVFTGSVDLALADPQVLVSHTAAAYGGFGISVAPGDLNGDGHADVAVGALAEAGSGAVHVYTGSSTGPEYVTAYLTEEAAASASLGTRISASGDLDGDGRRDLVMGAYQDSAGAAESGAVYVVMGANDLTSGMPVRIVSAAPEMNGWFGVSVAASADVDGDGRTELLCGALETAAGYSRAGRVHVYRHDGADIVQADVLETPSPGEDSVFGSGMGDTTVSGGGYDPI